MSNPQFVLAATDTIPLTALAQLPVEILGKLKLYNMYQLVLVSVLKTVTISKLLAATDTIPLTALDQLLVEILGKLKLFNMYQLIPVWTYFDLKLT